MLAEVSEFSEEKIGIKSTRKLSLRENLKSGVFGNETFYVFRYRNFDIFVSTEVSLPTSNSASAYVLREQKMNMNRYSMCKYTKAFETSLCPVPDIEAFETLDVTYSNENVMISKTNTQKVCVTSVNAILYQSKSATDIIEKQPTRICLHLGSMPNGLCNSQFQVFLNCSAILGIPESTIYFNHNQLSNYETPVFHLPIVGMATGSYHDSLLIGPIIPLPVDSKLNSSMNAIDQFWVRMRLLPRVGDDNLFPATYKHNAFPSGYPRHISQNHIPEIVDSVEHFLESGYAQEPLHPATCGNLGALGGASPSLELDKTMIKCSKSLVTPTVTIGNERPVLKTMIWKLYHWLGVGFHSCKNMCISKEAALPDAQRSTLGGLERVGGAGKGGKGGGAYLHGTPTEHIPPILRELYQSPHPAPPAPPTPPAGAGAGASAIGNSSGKTGGGSAGGRRAPGGRSPRPTSSAALRLPSRTPLVLEQPHRTPHSACDLLGLAVSRSCLLYYAFWRLLVNIIAALLLTALLLIEWVFYIICILCLGLLNTIIQGPAFHQDRAASISKYFKSSLLRYTKRLHERLLLPVRVVQDNYKDPPCCRWFFTGLLISGIMFAVIGVPVMYTLNSIQFPHICHTNCPTDDSTDDRNYYNNEGIARA